jgi:ABC-type branched-subunit amino acid transport system permease subunit
VLLNWIRENEQRAISLGYTTDHDKRLFVVQNDSLTDVHWTISGEVVLITLVGGRPSRRRIVVVPCSNILRASVSG